ncbi:hypothetical protein LVY72_00495 [Arthrobacter sp. I2-34]|uniref:Lipoprotein n=1 Tax=Arthrobacter hankyongi TaxID=2904801 RepID=A0ABS9L1E3_9MICC|nr:hypothetical protein [Arthrobacter hankyongi]MCG2620388.1 hypothetical protein [Arthrobacter hankyongi]
MTGTRGTSVPARRPKRPLLPLAAAALAAALALSGCTSPALPGQTAASAGVEPDAPQRNADQVYLRTAPAAPQLIGGTDAQAALAASAALFESSPLALVAAGGDAGAVRTAAGDAEALGVPLLLAGEGLAAELQRLGVRAVKTYGEPDGGWAPWPGGVRVLGADEQPQRPVAAQPASTHSVLLDKHARNLPATLAVVKASGARTRVDPASDPRQDPATVAFLREAPQNSILGIGASFGTAPDFARHAAAALTVPELPGGGLQVFPARRMVALYGHPSGAALGALGEQGIQAGIRRVRKLAAEYQPHSRQQVIPAFEIIASVATGAAGPDGSYSSMTNPDDLRPWIDAAGKAGVYVVLDLQPGRTDFLTQAKHYAALLKQPHVGLALDPEWRLAPGQRHMEQIGSVDAAEVNKVSAWLAGLTRQHHLPQKVFMIHQFRQDMVGNERRVDTSHEELATVLHADGHGTAGQKMETWHALRQVAPKGARMGWKNFYDEDRPTFTPKQTYRDVDPAPWFVSYQ